MLKCKFNFFTTQKLGDDPETNEDNYLIPGSTDGQVIKFAISDGATESSFSRQWSDLLVSSYKENSFSKSHFLDTLKLVSESWQSLVSTIELPWYAEQKTEIGAFATFIGLSINCLNNTFETVGIGDSTLFQIKSNKIHFSFPILAFEEFGNNPNLIASNHVYQVNIENTIAYSNGIIESSDTFLLASDAIAAWIFKQVEVGQTPWDQLMNIFNFENYTEDFQNWLKHKRESGEIKNDDITLIIINFE